MPDTNGAQGNAQVNGQVTDAVTQANVKVVAESNAVSNQNLQNMTAQAFTTQGVMQVYSVDTISDAIAVARMLREQ